MLGLHKHYADVNACPWHSTQCAVPTLLSPRVWEMNVTANETILSPSKGKEKNSLLSLSALQSVCEPSDAQRHSQPHCHARGQPAGGCWCSHWASLHTWHSTGVRWGVLTTHQLPQLGWHTSTGVLKARQLSFQGGNGSVSCCSLAALRQETASSYLLDRAVSVNKHLCFFFHLFHRLFLGSGSLWVSNNIKSVLLMISQVLLEGSTESRSDLVSFYFILEAPWGIQKACENPKTKRERKEKNPLTKKSICIWVPPKYVCQLHSAAHWDDISSVMLWLTELHKLFASL